MAIRMSTTFKGIEIKDAYIKISNIQIDNKAKVAQGYVEIATDGCNFAFEPLPFFTNVIVSEGVDVRDGIYEYLMELPEFSGATTC